MATRSEQQQQQRHRDERARAETRRNAEELTGDGRSHEPRSDSDGENWTNPRGSAAAQPPPPLITEPGPAGIVREPSSGPRVRSDRGIATLPPLPHLRTLHSLALAHSRGGSPGGGVGAGVKGKGKGKGREGKGGKGGGDRTWGGAVTGESTITASVRIEVPRGGWGTRRHPIGPSGQRGGLGPALRCTGGSCNDSSFGLKKHRTGWSSYHLGVPWTKLWTGQGNRVVW
ncbi:hypothetical protein NL676_018879 [Syzygium grande]|nr:hypothetical protein NL676_018879 [Syzygium grande]